MSGFRPPDPSEYNRFYRGYVAAVPDIEPHRFLREQADEMARRAAAVPAERETFRYAEGKWSIRQVFGHVADTERVFAFRTLAFARGDPAELPGMDQNVYMAGARFEGRSLSSIAAEFAAVRAATVHLVDSLAESDLDRQGVASGFAVTVRALLWIIAGHAQHHLNVLAERYDA